MKNREVAKILYDMATYLAMEDVAFKPQAYERAAMALESLGEDVEALYKNEGVKGLETVPGVGRGIAEKIEEYVKTGKVKEYENMRKAMPLNLEELGRIEGIGPKMMRDLWKHLKVKNLKDLERVAKAGKIRKLPNFGLKTEQNILQGIAFVKKSGNRWLLGTMYPYVEETIGLLKNSGLVKEAVAAGSIRRMKETIGDVDILVTSKKPKQVMDYFLSTVKYSKVWGKGPTKVSVRTLQGFDIDIRVLDEDMFGAGLQYFTGSKEHNVKVRTLAAQKGYKLSEYGLFKGEKRIACKTEEDVYKALGMPYIEPEMREDTGEVEAALAGKLPKLIEYNSLKGDLQVQTDWTDGKNSIEEMAQAAKSQGLKYIAITDHTQDLAMVGGSDEKKLLRQMAAIDKLNKKGMGIRILKGAEVNIRKDGSLDIHDNVLAKLDVVGASVHSYFKLTQKEQTARIIRVMQNPNVDIIFHLTGRFMPEREAISLDVQQVLQAAKRTKTILEINGAPSRLDLKAEHIREAVATKGIKFSIDSDSHNAAGFNFLRFGVSQARRGWAQKKDVINTMDVESLLDFLARKG